MVSQVAGAIGVAAAAAGIVWCAMHPADSVAVDLGGARGFCLLTMVVAGGWLIASTWAGPPRSLERLDWATLVMVAAVVGSGIVHAGRTVTPAIGGPLALGPPRGPIAAESIAWAAGGAAVIAGRRLGLSSMKFGVAELIAGVGVLLSIWAVHQKFVSLPATLAAFEADPAGTLRSIGIDAEAGSRARELFADRLRDGGPTASFALANTLAAALVVPWTICFAAAWSFQRVDRWAAAAAGLAAAIVGGAIVASGSTAGLVAALLATVLVSLARPIAHLAKGSGAGRVTAVGVAAGAVAAVGLAGTIVYVAAGGRLPTTLRYRVAYWRASGQMLAAEPATGVGPGLFQARYPAFRDIQSHEVIADPHNFLIETATSGGILAAAGLIALLALLLSRSAAGAASDAKVSGWWLAAGAAGAYLAAWYWAVWAGAVFEVDPQLIGLPIGVGLVWAAGPALAGVPAFVWRIGLAATLVDLSVSGGWTVPGVAAGMIAALAMGWPAGRGLDGTRGIWTLRCVGAVFVIAGAGLAIVGVGRLEGPARTLVADPATLKSAAQQELWRFQTTGNAAALRGARRVGAMALAIDPFDVAWLAQMAELERAVRLEAGKSPGVGATDRRVDAVIDWVSESIPGKFDGWVASHPRRRSERLAVLADRVGRLGGVYSRTLPYQRILPARRLGPSAASGPLRRPADEVLGDLLTDARGPSRLP